MKYYIIAGEASGDLHGSNLVKSIFDLDSKAAIRAWGGDMMKAANANIIKHYKDLAFMGFIEVVKNLPTILKNIQFCQQDIEIFQPDVLVLIDYPGFNLRIAKWAKAKGYKVVYYIAPQVWAWKANRVKSMKKNIDKMICILPFEKTYFEKKWAWNVEYIGHPLIEALAEKTSLLPNFSVKKNQIALLPGSRKQEIRTMLPIMLSITPFFQNYDFVIAVAPGQETDFYLSFIKNYPNVILTKDNTYAILLQSKAALVTSGTATLETALLNVPQLVCYKTNTLTYFLAKKLIKIKFIALANIIMDRAIIKECIQEEMNTKTLVKELKNILENEDALKQLKEDYKLLNEKLSFSTKASQKAAEIIVDLAANRA